MVINSISNEDIRNNHVKTLSMMVQHVMFYINAMIPKDKRTVSDIYPAEMTKIHKDYIIGHLQYIYDDLVER